MTPEEAVAATKDALLFLGRAFMVAPETYLYGQDVGFVGFEFYAAGRFGVLGAVDADIVAASAVFVHPARTRELWEAGLAVMPLEDAVTHWVEACRRWGRARYADDAATARLAELLERMVDGADACGRPLFAGWRRVPRCVDGPGRVNQALATLREQRGGGHDIAVLGQGLHPLEAMAARGELGLQSAAYFGWQEPYPDGTPFRARWEEAERVTDALAALTMESLSSEERAELAVLLPSAQEQALAHAAA